MKTYYYIDWKGIGIFFLILFVTLGLGVGICVLLELLIRNI